MRVQHTHERCEGALLDFEIEWDHIYLHLIWVDESDRRKGIARELMNRLTACADTFQLKILLDAHGDIPKDALLSFYEGHGFNLLHDDRMVRYPA